MQRNNSLGSVVPCVWDPSEARQRVEEMVEAAHSKPQLVLRFTTPCIQVSRASMYGHRPDSDAHHLTGEVSPGKAYFATLSFHRDALLLTVSIFLVVAALMDLLPMDASIISCSSGFIVATPHLGGAPRVVVRRKADGILFIPHIPGVSMKRFSVTLNHCLVNRYAIGFGDNGATKVSAVILFADEAATNSATFWDCLRYQAKEWSPNVAVAGTITDGVETFRCPRPHFIAGVAFGGNNLTASSIVVTAYEKAGIKAQIARLGPVKRPPRTQRVALLFSGLGRAAQIGCVIETRAFYSVYPDVPLFGLPSTWVIGHDSSSVRGEPHTLCDDWLHLSSSVFIMLTFGQPNA